MINTIVIGGRAGADGELITTPKGTPILNFRIAQNKKYGDKEATMWVGVKVFGKYGEVMAPYVKKGAQVVVDGELNVREYVAKDGQKKYVTEIIARQIVVTSSHRAHEDLPGSMIDSREDLSSMDDDLVL